MSDLVKRLQKAADEYGGRACEDADVYMLTWIEVAGLGQVCALAADRLEKLERLAEAVKTYDTDTTAPWRPVAEALAALDAEGGET